MEKARASFDEELDLFIQKLKSKGYSDNICDEVRDAYKEHIDLMTLGCNKTMRLEIVDINKGSRAEK